MPSPRTARAAALFAASFVLTACGASAASSRPSPTGPPATTPAPTPAPTDTPPPTGTAIHLVKDCSTYTAEIPTYCVITSTDYPPIPIGAKVNYLGPLLDNPHFLSSNALIDDAHGNTATGYCIFDDRPGEARGFCTFWAGTGSLAGFTAIMKVSIDSIGAWHLDGEYYGTTPTPGPS